MQTFSLDDDQYDSLLLMLGYATCAAMKEGNRRLAYSFVKLANAINRDNPRWRPYEIPDEFQETFRE